MNAVVPINELDIAQIEPGQQAIVRLDAVPGRTFEGVVQRKSIVPISDQNRRAWDEGSTSGPREFEVEIRMTGSNDLFRQGMTASVRIIVASAEDALIVPLEAITIRDGDLGVWRHSVLGAEFVPVKVELTNDLSAAVKANLAPGDKLFLRDPAGTIEDARIDTRAALARIKKDATPISSPSPSATNGGATAGGQGNGRGSGNRPRENGNAAPAASTTPGA
jgi:HlyD family secretion protein